MGNLKIIFIENSLSPYCRIPIKNHKTLNSTFPDIFYLLLSPFLRGVFLLIYLFCGGIHGGNQFTCFNLNYISAEFQMPLNFQVPLSVLYSNFAHLIFLEHVIHATLNKFSLMISCSGCCCRSTYITLLQYNLPATLLARDSSRRVLLSRISSLHITESGLADNGTVCRSARRSRKKKTKTRKKQKTAEEEEDVPLSFSSA